MANNRIQIKRSVANATVSGLSNGELAFTQASNTLHIGLPDGSGVLRIGGAQYPGTLTNNHALVANATGGIDKIITSNAVITTLWANGAAGTNGQVLVTNGSAVYWGTGTSGANTQVQFNDSGVANATAGFTFNKISNNLFVANTIQTANLFATDTVNASILSVGGWVIANNSGIFTSGVVNGDIIRVGSNVITNTSGVFAVGTVNASTLSVGSIVKANSTILQSNGLVVNSTGAYVSGIVNSTSFNAGSTDTGTGGTVQNTSNFFVGNNTVNTNITSAGLNVNNTTVVNSAGVFTVGTINAFSHTVGTDLVGNSSGLFATGTVNASLVSVGSSFTANSSKVVFTGSNVDATSATVEFLNLVVNGNTTVGNASSDRLNVFAQVTGNLNPSANSTYLLGNNSLRWAEIHSSNVHAISGYFDGSVQISGDLVVSGNVSTTNVSTLSVSDPLIFLAANNTSDILDIGFVGHYSNGVANLHTGLFRDASDGGVYKLFVGSEQELSGNNIVNTTANGFSLAILETFLESGAITSNNTTLSITANSTCNVNITANTLLLSTALAGTEGGTGYKTTIDQAILVGNATNGYNRLSLGTNGFVLQSNGSHLVYDYLDGGSF